MRHYKASEIILNDDGSEDFGNSLSAKSLYYEEMTVLGFFILFSNVWLLSNPKLSLMFFVGMNYLVTLLLISVATPHRSVEDRHFYRHLDHESSDEARMTQLLVWCIKRPLASDNRQRGSTASGKDPPASKLPSLSPVHEEILREVMESTVRMLTSKKIDTSVDGSARPDPRTQVKGNEQTEKNHLRRIRFTADIDRYVLRLLL
jgi:hypothetical protein